MTQPSRSEWKPGMRCPRCGGSADVSGVWYCKDCHLVLGDYDR